MAYRSLLTILTDPALTGPQLDRAIAVATAHDAHLDVFCIGLDRTHLEFYGEGASAALMQSALDTARADAAALEKAAVEQLRKSGLRYGTDAVMAQMANIGQQVADRARFSDLVVLPLPYGPEKGSEHEAVIEGALFEGQTPVLVTPNAAPVSTAPKRVLVAWNESAEALVAVRAALPILQQADMVHIVVIDPPAHSRNRSDPGGQLAQFLARHGVQPEIDVLTKTMPQVSDVIKRHATDVGADLIVMGAYGHSRFREAILGGATRNMLTEATIPVFMAH